MLRKEKRLNVAAVGLGSNIDPELHIAEAVRRIGRRHRILSKSRVVRTAPVGFSGQPDFLNCVVLIRTGMGKDELKSWLASVEKDMGRVRTENRYGPRTIDLDVAVWNGRIVDDDVYTRDFLKQGIQEVIPDLRL